MDLLHHYSKQSDGTPLVQRLVEEARASRRRASRAPAVKWARQLRPDEIDALIAHYRENGSVVAAAKALGVTRQTAGKHLGEAGISTIRRMSESDVATARSGYATGVSAAAMGRRLGFSTNTVIKAIRSDLY